jgi:hypothetical protein
MIKIIKSAFIKVFEAKVMIVFGIMFVCGTTAITTLYTQYISKKTVKEALPNIVLQMANKSHAKISIINEKLVELIGQCNHWSGGAWLVYDGKTKIVRFVDVFANDPYFGGVYSTKYLDGNDFYRREHVLDSFAYEKIALIEDYDVVDMSDDLWSYSSFFVSFKTNVWKITNSKFEKLNIKPIQPQALFLSTIKYSGDLIYIFAITTTANKFCNTSSMVLTDNEKIHYTGVALKKIALESSDILSIFKYDDFESHEKP